MSQLHAARAAWLSRAHKRTVHPPPHRGRSRGCFNTSKRRQVYFQGLADRPGKMDEKRPYRALSSLSCANPYPFQIISASMINKANNESTERPRRRLGAKG